MDVFFNRVMGTNYDLLADLLPYSCVADFMQGLQGNRKEASLIL